MNTNGRKHLEELAPEQREARSPCPTLELREVGQREVFPIPIGWTLGDKISPGSVAAASALAGARDATKS